MNEAMIKIRYELGSDAVIVSQRKIKQKGPLGLFKPRKLEVTAAVDDRSKKNKELEEHNKLFQNEILELKTMLQSVITPNIPSKYEYGKGKKTGKSKFKLKLIENDIPEEIAEVIFSRIREKNRDKKLTVSHYEKEFKNILNEMIKINNNFSNRVQVLVGPTGVGKTTTIAKLASLYTLYKNKQVGLITIDTYRIGAVEQLKTYSEILGIPFDVVISARDLSKAINRMSDCDVILVDTTGRNSKNAMQVSEIRSFINEINPDTVHLVLSMTTKQKDLKRIIEDYKVTNYNSLILTKVDETNSYGSILASIYYSDMPVSYISTGQNVPDDIEEADLNRLSKLIIGAEN